MTKSLPFIWRIVITKRELFLSSLLLLSRRIGILFILLEILYLLRTPKSPLLEFVNRKYTSFQLFLLKPIFTDAVSYSYATLNPQIILYAKAFMRVRFWVWCNFSSLHTDFIYFVEKTFIYLTTALTLSCQIPPEHARIHFNSLQY